MNCNSSVAMVHLLNAVFGHKNNQIRNARHRNCASASSCTDATSQRNKHRADLRATTNSGQRAPHHQRVQTPWQPLTRRSVAGSGPRPANAPKRAGSTAGARTRALERRPREMERGSRPTAASPLARTRGPGQPPTTFRPGRGPTASGALLMSPGAASLPRQFELQEGRDTRRRAATIVWRRTGVLFERFDEYFLPR